MKALDHVAAFVVEAPALLQPRRKFDPARMSKTDRRAYEHEIASAPTVLARLRAESKIAGAKLGRPPG